MEQPSGEWSPGDSALEVESLVSRSCPVEDVSLGAFLDAIPEPTETHVSWASPTGLEVAACGTAAKLSAEGNDRFGGIERQADAVFESLIHDGPRVARPRAFGGFSFHVPRDRAFGQLADEPTTAAEPSANGQATGVSVIDSRDPWRGFDAATFVVPRVQVTRTDDGPWLTVVTGDDETTAETGLERLRETIEGLPTLRPAGSPPGVVDTERTADRRAWTERVKRSLELIDGGRLEKVVLAQALIATLEADVSVTQLQERLRRRYPNCFRFVLDLGTDRTFFGAPPERLVKKRGDTLTTEALAGSVPRGDSPEPDDEHLEHLFGSERLNREHEFVLEAIRTQLEALADDVHVADRTVRQLATIQHLRTPLSADVDHGRHVLSFVEALHPTPAVGGVPQRAACDAIRTLERFDRGWYAGPIGWFDADGDGEFAVAIRSGVAADRSVTLFAGNGIVADSDPDTEWNEVTLKLRAILDELG